MMDKTAYDHMKLIEKRFRQLAPRDQSYVIQNLTDIVHDGVEKKAEALAIRLTAEQMGDLQNEALDDAVEASGSHVE